MRTTIDLPDDLYRRVKARAAMEGLKLKDLIAEYVVQGLDPKPAPPPVKRHHSQLPVMPHPRGTTQRAFTNAELQEMFDAEDYGVERG
jgi:hypothetical protein